LARHYRFTLIFNRNFTPCVSCSGGRKKMLKKIGLPMAALAGLLAFGAPRAAQARVHVGVALAAPVYAAPVTPYPYGYPYAAPAPYVDPYYAPTYVAPYSYVDPYFSVGIGGGWGGGYYGHGYVGHGYAPAFHRGGGFGHSGGFHGGGHGGRR
jgi:hypothetical protein